MAEPLTSSDIIRERMGFGVSPLASEDTRRAYFEAGLSPLGTKERERLEEGRGISPMASKVEKDAWVAAEVMAGSRPESDLPESYGGIGERPKTPKTGFYATGEETAYGRRMRRMQEDWDAQNEIMREQERERRDIFENNRAYNLEREKYDLDTQKESLKKDREERILKEAGIIMTAIRGGQQIGPNKFSEPIRPEDPDAIERLTDLMRLPYGMENDAAKEAVETIYNDAMNIRSRRMETSQEQELAAANLSAKAGVDMKQLGEYDERGLFKPNLNAIAKVEKEMQQMEEAEKTKKEEEKEIRKEQRAEEKEKRTQINKLDSDIRDEQLKLIEEASTLGIQVNPDGTFDSVGLSESRRNKLKGAQDRIRLIEMEKAQVQGFDFQTVEQAEKAESEGKIPSGSVIFVNGKRAIVD